LLVALVVTGLAVASSASTATSPSAHVVPPGVARSSDSVAWRADYETADFSQWSGVHPPWRTERASIVTSPVRSGRYAARFEVRAGDSVPSGGELSQAYADAPFVGAREGEDWYYAWSTYIPSGQRWGVFRDWNVITEWLGTRCGSPPLQLGVLPSSPPSLYLAAVVPPDDGAAGCGVWRGGKWTFPLVRDRWMDLVVHVGWSTDPANGFVELWQDGIRRLPRLHVATLYPDSGAVYLKHGFYRGAADFTNVVYSDEFRRARNFDELPDSFRPAEASQGARVLARLRRSTERAGHSWERFLREHPEIARAGGIVGLDSGRTRFYTRAAWERRLRSRHVEFGRWQELYPTESVKLDLAASSTPYAAFVGRPVVRNGVLEMTIRSALATRVTTETRDANGRLVGLAQSRMRASGMLEQRVRLRRPPGKSLSVVVTTLNGPDKAVLGRRVAVRDRGTSR
jgi:hypothetical protein